MRPTLVSISGFSSNVGKTTLVCDLLKLFPGWEAIKVSRGHYRSCGKSPSACCIGPLLGEKPLVLSGREGTYSEGKDSGRYWESGASNVHWVVCTSDQVEEGVGSALALVRGEGVFIEGTSVLKYFPVDYSVIVAKPGSHEIKSSAARVISKVDTVYIAGARDPLADSEEIRQRLIRRGAIAEDLPVDFEADAGSLARKIGRVHAARLARAEPGIIAAL
ncbi:MAG TPA: hypothetical protein VE262_13670 [Blastocatellia bacterium]|nr:hypothetical protein [Blastocatellia bacterium]